ncbi:MAG: T9SS type A sorting domain-containing protein [Bacteroidota bacterium]
MSRFSFFSLAFFFLFLVTSYAGAQTIAFDSAGTSAYTSGWSAGSNGGDGFNAWVIDAGSNTGVFIGNPANDGMGTAGIGTKAFGIFATGTGYLNATRTFKQALQIGDELSFYWSMNWDAGAGTKGFDIKSGTTTVYNINNGNASPRITSSAETALFEYGTKPMLVKLKRTASDLYSFSMTGRVEGENYSTTINTALPVNGISFYIGNQSSTAGQRNIYFNNFKITGLTSSANELTLVKKVSIYPNPVASNASVQLKLSNQSSGIYHLSIYNMAGVLLMRQQFNHPGGSSLQLLKLNDISPGTYIAELRGRETRDNFKLVVVQ